MAFTWVFHYNMMAVLLNSVTQYQVPALSFLYVSDSATFCKLLEHSQVRPETHQDY